MSTPASTHHYLFARIFIRLAIALAVLTVVAGLGAAAMTLSSLWSKWQATRYKSSPELLLQTQKLQQLYEGTQKRLLEAMEETRFPESVPVVDWNQRLAALSRSAEERRPVLLEEVVDATAQSVEAMQNYHAQSFVAAIEELRQAMLQRAAELRQSLAPPPAADANATPSDPAATAVPSPEPTQPPAPNRFRLYRETGTDAAFSDQRRWQTLEKARDFLQQLREQSRKEESLRLIRRAQIFLTQAEALLDSTQLPEPPPLPSLRSPVQKQQVQEEALVSAAELRAGELSAMLEEVQVALYSRWRVEEQLDRLALLAAEERQRAERLADEARALLVSESQKAILILLGALGLAFAILVIADFLRAFLNLSNNSDRLVALVAQPPAGSAAPSTASNPPGSMAHQ